MEDTYAGTAPSAVVARGTARVAFATGVVVAFAVGSLAVEPNREKPVMKEALALIRTLSVGWNHVIIFRERALWFFSENWRWRCVDEFSEASGLATNSAYDAAKSEKLRSVAAVWSSRTRTIHRRCTRYRSRCVLSQPYYPH